MNKLNEGGGKATHEDALGGDGEKRRLPSHAPTVSEVYVFCERVKVKRKKKGEKKKAHTRVRWWRRRRRRRRAKRRSKRRSGIQRKNRSGDVASAHWSPGAVQRALREEKAILSHGQPRAAAVCGDGAALRCAAHSRAALRLRVRYLWYAGAGCVFSQPRESV